MMFSAWMTTVFAFQQSDLLRSLEILWKGMLAILIVIGIIMAVTALMNFFSFRAEDRRAAQQKAESEDRDGQNRS